MCQVGAEGVLPVLSADVAAAPDAGADPDAYDGDDHDDEENHPLVVITNPGTWVVSIFGA